MTVNEIEARTGLDRGTVRYYEAEGLISPAREPNGYRNYSEDDLEKLLKVKLLRALNFSVDDIRAMDADSADFPERLRARARSLEARREDIGDLKRVLELMLSDGARYESLNSGHYLCSIAQRPPEIAAPPPEEDAGTKRAANVPGPWRRYLARILDFSLLEFFILAVSVLVFHAPVYLRMPWPLISMAAAELAELFLEPLCLTLFGSTPGKALLGIYVLAPDGEKLSYREGLRRTWGALSSGMGLRIPILSQIFLFFNYRDARRGVEMVWEKHSRLGLSDSELSRNIAYGVATAALVGASLFVYTRSLLPPERGDITPAELAENVNRYYLSLHDVSDYPIFFDPGFRLRPDGLWDDSGIWEGRHVTGDISPAKVELTVEDGAVTALRWRQSVTETDSGYYGRLGDYVTALTWGFVGSDRSVGLLDLHSLIRDADLTGFRGFDIEYGQWRVKCVTFMPDGSEVYSGAVHFPGGGQGSFGVELTIQRGDSRE